MTKYPKFSTLKVISKTELILLFENPNHYFNLYVFLPTVLLFATILP